MRQEQTYRKLDMHLDENVRVTYKCINKSLLSNSTFMRVGYVCAEVGHACTTIMKYDTMSLYSTNCKYNINPFHTGYL